jgi:hypothetical protein
MKTQSHSRTVPTSRTAAHDLPGEQLTKRLFGYGAIAALAALALTLFLAACSREKNQADSSRAMPSMATGDSAKMGGMPMGNMSGMMGMMTEMTTHMQSMTKASGEQMKGMVPAPRQMTANMLAEMSARELEDVMPAHQARMMRLMQMHQAMSKNMKM